MNQLAGSRILNKKLELALSWNSSPRASFVLVRVPPAFCEKRQYFLPLSNLMSREAKFCRKNAKLNGIPHSWERSASEKNSLTCVNKHNPALGTRECGEKFDNEIELNQELTSEENWRRIQQNTDWTEYWLVSIKHERVEKLTSEWLRLNQALASAKRKSRL
jgi:hypothetical protein